MEGRLILGVGGWCCWTVGATTAFVRFAERGGRLVVVELYVSGDAITTDDLRQIPLGRIEAIANGDVADRIRERAAEKPGPDILPMLRFLPAGGAVPAKRSLRLSSRHRAIASGRRRPYPDDFYAAVAGIYRSAAERSRAPAALIADANGVPVTTVHRWVRMARKRNHLPPGSPGKAG